MKDLITIGLPSKGRLKDKAISFFEESNFERCFKIILYFRFLNSGLNLL